MTVQYGNGAIKGRTNVYDEVRISRPPLVYDNPVEKINENFRENKKFTITEFSESQISRIVIFTKLRGKNLGITNVVLDGCQNC